jgi:hypothetical protein
MGLLQTLIYTGLPVVGIILFLLGETSGYNFALKVNLIANFFAPMLAYNIAEMLGIGFVISPTRAFMFEFIFILVVTFLIIYTIAILSIYKAAGGDVTSLVDNEDTENRTKTSCSSFKITSALKHGLKIAFGGVITFFAVANMPSLQQPFVKMASKYSDNSIRIVYSIIGFYMALVSLSTVSFTYFPAIEEGCKMNEQELEDAFSKGYPTLSYLKYERLEKKDKLGMIADDEQEKDLIKNMMDDTNLLRDKCSIPEEITGVSKFNINLTEGAIVGGITNIKCSNDKGKIYYNGTQYKTLHKEGINYYLSNKGDKTDKKLIKEDQLTKIYCFDILGIKVDANIQYTAEQDIVYKKVDRTRGVLKKGSIIIITTIVGTIIGVQIQGGTKTKGTVDKMYFTSKYFTKSV